jgi:hypothetical protein
MPSASIDTVPPPPISVPTVVSPARTASAVEVRGSPRLLMTTVCGASKASTASMLRRSWAGSGVGSTTPLGMMLSDEPPECRSRNASQIG